MNKKMRAILDRYEVMKTRRQKWQSVWQRIGELVMNRKVDFQGGYTEGTITSKLQFDSTAPNANIKSSAAILALIYVGDGKSLSLKPIHGMEENTEVNNYLKSITKIFSDTLSLPETNMAKALEEYMVDQTSFGTSSLLTEEVNGKIAISAWGVDNMLIDEDYNGVPEYFILEHTYTAREIVRRFKKVSTVVRKAAHSSPDDKIKVIQYIGPRKESEKTQEGYKSFKYESYHLEVDTGYKLEEGGFRERPISTGRMYKRAKEMYGRSFASESLPTIELLNFTKAKNIEAFEKLVDPAIYSVSGTFLNNQINTSPGSHSILNQQSALGGNVPFGKLLDTGNPKEIFPFIQMLIEDVTQAFHVDRLIDFNNKTQMTLGEVEIRDQNRREGFVTMYSRQISDVFDPTFDRALAIMLRNGNLGYADSDSRLDRLLSMGQNPLVIPDALVELMDQGKPWYRIKYNTPVNAIMNAAQVRAISQLLEVVGVATQAVSEDARDNVDIDNVIRYYSDIKGLPQNLMRDPKEIKKIRAERKQMMMDAQNAENNKKNASAGKDQAMGNKANFEAQAQ